MKSANGCGHFLRRLWPGHYSLTPMLPSWVLAPTVLYCHKLSLFLYTVCYCVF